MEPLTGYLHLYAQHILMRLGKYVTKLLQKGDQLLFVLLREMGANVDTLCGVIFLNKYRNKVF